MQTLSWLSSIEILGMTISWHRTARVGRCLQNNAAAHKKPLKVSQLERKKALEKNKHDIVATRTKKNWKVISHYFSVSPTPIFLWCWHRGETSRGYVDILCQPTPATRAATRPPPAPVAFLLTWDGICPCWETVQFHVFFLKENKENWPFQHWKHLY